MKYRILIIIILTLQTVCTSCLENKNDQPIALYRQRISNSSKVIYDFSFDGPFVTSSEYSGFSISDSIEPFSKNRINKLPCTYFLAKPTRSEIRMIDIDYGQSPRSAADTLLTPTRTYSKIIEGMSVEVTQYKDTYGSATTSTGFMEYEFDRFEESTDSLTLYNVTKRTGGRQFPTIVSFAKGNIKVVDSANYDIVYIAVDEVIIQRSDIYKPTKPFELVPNQPVIGLATYCFYPRTIIKSTALTDYGIFKPVK